MTSDASEEGSGRNRKKKEASGRKRNRTLEVSGSHKSGSIRNREAASGGFRNTAQGRRASPDLSSGTRRCTKFARPGTIGGEKVVQPGGVEPPTYRSVVCRSIQLSYGCTGSAVRKRDSRAIGAPGATPRPERVAKSVSRLAPLDSPRKGPQSVDVSSALARPLGLARRGEACRDVIGSSAVETASDPVATAAIAMPAGTIAEGTASTAVATAQSAEATGCRQRGPSSARQRWLWRRKGRPKPLWRRHGPR